jgi:hypothetical protein
LSSASASGSISTASFPPPITGRAWRPASAAITDGPAGLTIHALLGVALLASAVTLVVRSVLVRRAWPIMLAVLGLCAIGVSAINGSRFVGDPGHAASLAIGMAAAVAILCYVIIGLAATARLSS